MTREKAREFMDKNFKPITEGSYFDPIISLYKEIPIENKKGEEVVFFAIHHITNFINDEWEIKSDKIFIAYERKIYFLKDITTNYNHVVRYPKYDDDFKFFPSLGAQIAFSEEETNSGPHPNKVQMVPRDQWELINEEFY